jgi:hypothetical protein
LSSQLSTVHRYSLVAVLNDTFRRRLVLTLYTVCIGAAIDNLISSMDIARRAHGRSDDEQYWQVTEKDSTSTWTQFAALINPLVILGGMVASFVTTLRRGLRGNTPELSTFARQVLENFGISTAAASSQRAFAVRGAELGIATASKSPSAAAPGNQASQVKTSASGAGTLALSTTESMPSFFTGSTPMVAAGKSATSAGGKRRRPQPTTEQQLVRSFTLLSGGIAFVWLLGAVIFTLSPTLPHFVGLLCLLQAVAYATEASFDAVMRRSSRA